MQCEDFRQLHSLSSIERANGSDLSQLGTRRFIPYLAMERSIPHIRSIFSNTSSRKKSTSDTQDLCQYDKSPRSKKKTKEPPADYYEKHDIVNKSSNSPKKNAFDLGKENVKSKDESRKSNNRNGNYNTYTSKTLTERDMRHLERHLSMKKTIRKQISRNLAQAFLDNPDIFEPEDYKPETHKNDHKLPGLPGDSNIEKPEQNVLDLLKISIEDRDSGHSSPTHDTLEDSDEDEIDEEVKAWKSSSMKHRDSETTGLVDERPKPHNQESEKKSIWKMFSSRNKSKR
ncbi:uncharacterized protein TNIN_133411 [Trichonephila inaurata madagascariensis]|uniref:Uncharacterized protein n=1 Tax=Trichonephila inaurata madagascariensis TaxID=2747483 RepID=A0A8X7C0L6_9ARAC|nr:uncharacterized protein TNIN_133411 [Trichonephila inaurata madagascariensis]